MNQDILLSHHSTKKPGQTHENTANQLFQHDGIGNYGHHYNRNSGVSYNSQEFSPKQTILPTTNLTSDKSSSFILSNRRTLASELAANAEDLSASLITTTRPPSSFDHQSLHSYTSYRGGPDLASTNKISTSSSSAYGNDHNIWGINRANHGQNENDTNKESADDSDKHSGTEHQQDQSTGSDNRSDAGADFVLTNPRDVLSSHYPPDDRQRQQRPFYSGYHNSRPLSPGQYFGARSLPLESMGDLWQQPPSSLSPSYPMKLQKQAILSRSSSPTMNNLASEKKISNNQIHSVNQRSSASESASASRSRSTASASASYPNGSRTSSDMEPLWQNFKALPASLHHRHHWNRWEIHQQRTSTPRSRQRDNAPSSTPPARSTLSRTSASMSNDNDEESLTEKVQSLRIQDGNANTTKSGHVQQQQQQQQHRQRQRQQLSYSLHPHDSVTIKCLISSTTIHTHDGHLTLTNNNDDNAHIDDDDDEDEDQDHGKPLVFSLFSANGNVTFDVQSGTVSPGQTINIWIRPRKRILHRLVTTSTNNSNTANRHITSLDETTALFDESVALLVGQDLYRLKVNLDITIEDPEDDDEDNDDDDDQQQQQHQHGQDEQDKSGDSGDEHLDQTTTTPPSQVIGKHDDTDRMTATSTMENQDHIDKTTTTTTSTSQDQDHEEPCPFCLLETLYPSS